MPHQHPAHAAAGLQRAVLALLAVSLGVPALTACVPLPYKPAAAVTHVPIEADAAAGIVVSSAAHLALVESIAHDLQRAEPRVVLVDSITFTYGSLPGGAGTLAALLTTGDQAAQPRAADCLLSVGAIEHRQLHDTGMAAPFPYLPVFWVGYEKVQSRDTLAASFVDLRDPGSADALLVTSAYSEVIAAMAYGVATVARPAAAIREQLVRDVARRLAAAYPRGAIRLVVLTQRSSAGEGSAAGEGAAADGAPPL